VTHVISCQTLQFRQKHYNGTISGEMSEIHVSEHEIHFIKKFVSCSLEQPLWFVHLIKYYSGDQIKENEMGGACCTYKLRGGA
jgi:hypothetical protein